MLPAVEDDISQDYEVEEQPSLSWRLDTENLRISGEVDKAEAVKQAIYCILNTERYETLIYPWNYGVELKELIGEPLSYFLPELKRRIREALLQDDRISEVGNFEFEVLNKKSVHVSFTVETCYGDVDVEKEVEM